ncbi:hypothetical protein, partial [Acetobacter malorum]|uniref:hypothetical protein n=1 Tax=Acetobacter malorum TaxID=178901 RepID=UPI00248D893A
FNPPTPSGHLAFNRTENGFFLPFSLIFHLFSLKNLIVFKKHQENLCVSLMRLGCPRQSKD